MKIGLISAVFVVLVTIVSTAVAMPTDLTVRVKTKDAKFMGSSMGGALITIRNADTGELLAKGIISGSTGNTELLLNPKRGVAMSDPGAAKFTCTINIDEPTYVEIRAYGPLSQRQSANTVTMTQWVIPGKHLTGGDGLVLEMPGFAVSITVPPSHLVSTLSSPGNRIEVMANITMMWGCPITPGGVWDSNKYEIKGLLKRDGKPAGEVPLHYANKPNHFAATLDITERGIYELTIFAYDPTNGNTGIDRVTFVVN